jgi:hypothetical protein
MMLSICWCYACLTFHPNAFIILELSTTMCRHTLHDRIGVSVNTKEKTPPLFWLFAAPACYPFQRFKSPYRNTCGRGFSSPSPLLFFQPVYSSGCVIIYRRLPRRSDATSGHHVSGSVATAATAAAGEAGDDDVEEADDAVDDGG